MTESAPIDLYDQDSYERQGPPHDGFRRLRAEDPVHWHDMPGDTGFWAITRYKDLFTVSLDQKTFSSQKGGVILRTWKPEEFEAQKNMLINLDPPEHTK